MKLAFVNSSFPEMPCGVGDYAANLARAAGDAGHEVVVFTSADPRVRVPERPEVHPVFRDWAIRDFFAHLGKIRRERPDTVVLQYPSVLPGRHSRLLFLLPLLSRSFLPSARVVLVMHEYGHTHGAARHGLRLAFRFAHEVVTVTPADQRAIGERHPRTRSKLRAASIGSNVPRVALTEARRAELAAKAGDASTLLFFGLLHGPDKGLDDLLSALHAMGSTDVTLLVSGSLDEGVPYHREVRERIEALGLADRVRWLGFLAPDALSEWLQAADVVVLPFRGGAAPNRGTLAAALLNGAATVTTRGAETPDYLRDGENVALVAPGDRGALATAIGRLLESPAERERLREGARQLAPAFEWPAVAAETLGTAAARPPDGDWPAEDLEHVPHCPVCRESARRRLYSNLTDRVSFVAPGRWTLWSCARCGAAYLDPRPSGDTIGRAYRSYHTHGEPAAPHEAPPGWAGRLRWALANGYLNRRYGYDFAPASRLGCLASLLPRRRWLADMRVRHLPRTGAKPRLLDVGCGNGTFLRDMRDAGWEVAGIDPDPGAVASARATGAEVKEGLLTRDTFRPESFDAVTLSHVIEHLPEPAETLAICRDLLRPGGLVWIATPNLDSRGHRRFRRSWRGLEPPRHLVVYTELALTGLLERLGFEVVATPRSYMAEFFFGASAAIAAGQHPERMSLPERPGLRRRARVANALTVVRPAGTEELTVVARKPGP
jgi:glycosyltransferase involved in cell wall biosynthesis/SAM-dependent methyltransferase